MKEIINEHKKSTWKSMKNSWIRQINERMHSIDYFQLLVSSTALEQSLHKEIRLIFSTLRATDPKNIFSIVTVNLNPLFYYYIPVVTVRK